MTTSSIEAVIFDWHGVLDKRRFHGIIDLISDMSGIVPEKVKQDLWQPGQDYAAGTMSPDQFWSKVKRDYRLDHSKLGEVQRYLLTVEKDQELWELLPQLEFRLAILSDCPKDKTQVIRTSVDLSVFERTYFSSDVGLLKSDPEFFLRALTDLRLSQKQCLFVDDSNTNIRYADALGLQTHLYKGAIELSKIIKNKLS